MAALVSLVAVAIGFTALVVYVYRPSQRENWRRKGALPLDLEPPRDDSLDASEGEPRE